jgi:DNA-binding SARP family transcriptional activator/tetratricopeptide (TPR) repeat protein
VDRVVRFALLGPVRAWRGGIEIDLRPRQLRHVMGLLLLRAGRPVTVEEFATLLWGEAPPMRAADIVHRHIGTLRRLLEPDLAYRVQGRWLQRAAGGYRLDAEPESLDLLEFRRLAEQGRHATEIGDHAKALALRTEALRLWHGRCGADLDPDPEMLPEFHAVDQERVAVARAAVDDALATGDTQDLMPIIREVAEQNPLDEALQARLMLLLAATGRQAAALGVFHSVRSRLVEELGVDPGPDLRTAYDRVLRQEAVPEPPAPRAIPSQVPAGTRYFSGRSAELARLTELLAETGRDRCATVVGVVDGLPGVGKTSLVTHWARQMADEFPDGQLFVNLQGFDVHRRALDADQALAHLLAGMGVPHERIPADAGARNALFRTMTADRRMLIILDNARDEEHVRPLLPSSPLSLVLVTSRNRLTGLIAQEGAAPLILTPPSHEDSRTGMRARLGAGRIAGEEGALDEIIERCGRLPLAMAVVCGRALTYPEWSLRDIADELRMAAPLDFFDGEEPRSDVRNVFSWSYRMLSESAARLFRLLPVHPGPDFGPVGVANLAGLPLHTVRQLLRELARTRLLTETRPGRYAFHDLIKAYAAELGKVEDPEAYRIAAFNRMLDHLTRVGHEANIMLHGSFRSSEPPAVGRDATPEPIADTTAAMTWFTTELAVLEDAVEIPGANTWRLAELLMPYYQRRAMFQRWTTTAEHALRAAIDADDLEGQAAMNRMLAGAMALGGRNDLSAGRPGAEQRILAAAGPLQRALALLDVLDRPLDKAHVYRNLGTVHAEAKRPVAARENFKRALALFEAAGDRRGIALTLFTLGQERTKLGDIDGGLSDLRRAEATALELDDVNTAGSLAGAIAQAQVRLGRTEEALASYHRARDLLRRAGNALEVAVANRQLGDLLATAGQRDEAVLAWREARDRYTELGQVDVAARLVSRIEEFLREASAPRPLAA